MGRTLTEPQKAERAAKKIEAKHRDELGPLFEGQAPAIDRDALLMQRRHGWAHGLEDMNERFGAGTYGLALMEVLALERLARKHLSGEDVDALAAYAFRVYPCEDYWRAFWLDVLSGARRVAMTTSVVVGPDKTLTLTGTGGQVTTITIPGRTLVHERWLPREGWVSPFPPGWRNAYYWRRCDRCRMYHAPGQSECSAPVPVIDGAALDADAEAVLASFRRAG